VNGEVSKTANRTYRFRLYPNREQRQVLARTFGCSRFVYNWALRRRSDEYHTAGKSLSFAQLSRDLTALKKDEETEWLGEVSAVTLQQSLRNLDTSFTNFFEGRAQYPRFKSKKRSKQAARYVGTAFAVKEGKLQLAKVPGRVRVRWSRELPSEPTSCTVTLDPSGRYHVSFACAERIEPLPTTTKSVGLDLGLTHFVTTSDGEKVDNPRHFEQTYRKLRRAQKKLARKVKGSNGREKQRRKVARLHAKISDQRQDFLHKLSTRLIHENGMVACESLAVVNMVKNRSLSRAIGQAGWGEFVRQLEYKAEWYGRTVARAERFFPSSKRCSNCGHIVESLPLSVREWTCPECEVKHDRDVNAAENLRSAGHARTSLAKSGNAPGDLGKSSEGFALIGSSR